MTKTDYDRNPFRISVGQKRLNTLKKRRLSNMTYQRMPEIKKDYAIASRDLLRQLRKDISERLETKHGATITSTKISYDPGNAIAAGETWLRFIMNNGGGLAICINSKGSDFLACRAIKSLKDDTGDSSEWDSDSWIKINESYEEIVARIVKAAVAVSKPKQERQERNGYSYTPVTK